MTTATDARGLLPCPFCGGNKILESAVYNTGGHRRFLYCKDCLAQGPWSHKPLSAAEQWNRRPTAAPVGVPEEPEVYLHFMGDHAESRHCVMKSDYDTLRTALAAARSEADWAEREVLEIMRIVGPGDGSDDDIIRLMKLTAIRRMLEADVDKYTALADKHMEPALKNAGGG